MNVSKLLSPLGFTLITLAVQPAMAQVDPDCTGNNPGTVTCTGVAIYADGVTHSATTGDLTVNVGDGVTSFGTGGFTTTATGDHSITMTKGTSGAMLATPTTGTRSPAVISALSEDGDISITTALGLIQGAPLNSQYGILAQSTGLGDISLNVNSVVTQNGAPPAVGIAAIEALSGGGDISITTTNAIITGRQYGIRAIAEGAGNIAITVNAQVRHSTSAGIGIAAIEAIADTGDIVLGINNTLAANNEKIILASDGSTTVNIRASVGGTAHQNMPFQIGGTGQATINIIGGTTYGTLAGGVDARSSSGDVVINNQALSGAWSIVGSALQLGGGNDLINNEGLFILTPENAAGLTNSSADFGAGDDRIRNTGTIVVGSKGFGFTRASTPAGPSDLGLGIYRPSTFAPSFGNAEMVNLETFENAGLIVLGAFTYSGGTGGFASADIPENFGQRFYTSDAAGEAFCRRALSGVGLSNPPPDGFLCTESALISDTDYLNANVLSLPGTHFVGGEGSRILLDAVFGEGLAQRDCQQRLGGDEVRFRLPGADCVDIIGGSTSGRTEIIVRDIRPKDQGTINLDGIVLIDVSGGTSAAEHFALSPESDGYGETDDGRGFIDKGLFVFPLIYDAATQQHKLIGIAGTSAYQLPLMANAAQTLGRQSTGVGLEGRVQGWQAALRAGSQLRGGFWAEGQQDEAERDVVQSTMALGETFAFNNDFEQDTSTMILGGDFIVPMAGKAAWVMGGSIGYARAQVGFDASGNEAEMEGVVLGLHGGYQTESWYLNAAYGQSFLQVDHYVPTYNLTTAGSGADTKAGTESLLFDGGFRLALADNLHVEPLASLAWVRADFDDLVIAAPDNPLATRNTARFDNAVSLRGALGARIGFDMPSSSLRVHYGLTGRYWNEFDGESGVAVQSVGPDTSLSDTFDGSFLDLAGRIGISDASGNVSGYIDARSTSGDDYSSLGLSAGFRYQW